MDDWSASSTSSYSTCFVSSRATADEVSKTPTECDKDPFLADTLDFHFSTAPKRIRSPKTYTDEAQRRSRQCSALSSTE